MIPIADFAPVRAPGRIERIYLHWSGGDYSTTYDAYHWCIAAQGGRIVVVETRDPRENMRDVYTTPGEPYGAHVYRRNSFALGISIMAMQDATPHDFGAYPITDALVDALCAAAARVARAYALAVTPDTIATHAEAALADGYFGSGDDERWDIARLRPSPEPLHESEARSCADELRRRIERA